METVNAVGRRKAAIARVILTEGNGEITINHRELGKYFPSSILQYIVKQPLTTLDVTEKYGNVEGGEGLLNDVLENRRCLLYTSPSPRDGLLSRMPSSA